jgi:hypothetical protein
LAADAHPAVASIAKTDTTIVFTGTNFFTAGFDGNASLAGIYADTVVIDSATQVTATWAKGVPALSSPKVPVLSFKDQTADSSLEHFSVITANVVKDLSVSSSSQSLECSFAGGCSFKVAAAGLSS